MTQPALFDNFFIPDLAVTSARGLECLRDVVPEALDVVRHLGWWKDRDERRRGASGDWAYRVCERGVYFGARAGRGEWKGWDHNPIHLLGWAELTSLIADDPRRTDVQEWASSLTAIDRWRDLYRPFELWPHADRWHPSYIEGDRERTGYSDRMHAWRTTQAILTTAIDRCLDR